MKIAFATDDGESAGTPFGRATGYLVVTADEGDHGEHSGERGGRGVGPAAGMLEPIGDCDLLVTRGMGTRALEAARAAHIRPIITNVRRIDVALDAYLVGSLEIHLERLH